MTTAVPHDELRNRIVHAEDRFVAAGGELTLRADGDAVVIEGVVPCGS